MPPMMVIQLAVPPRSQTASIFQRDTRSDGNEAERRRAE